MTAVALCRSAHRREAPTGDVDDSPDEAEYRARVRSLKLLLGDEAEHLDAVARLAVDGALGA